MSYIFYPKQKVIIIVGKNEFICKFVSFFILMGAPGFDGCNRAFDCMSRILGHLVNNPGKMISADYGYAAAA